MLGVFVIRFFAKELNGPTCGCHRYDGNDYTEEQQKWPLTFNVIANEHKADCGRQEEKREALQKEIANFANLF